MGQASNFAHITLTKYNDNEEAKPDPTLKIRVWPTWPMLKKAIEDHFYINMIKEEAYCAFTALKQGQMPIEVFTQQFNILRLDTGVDNAYALHIYKENIDYNIYFQISLQEPAVVDMLSEWKKHVVVVEKTFNWMRLE